LKTGFGNMLAQAVLPVLLPLYLKTVRVKINSESVLEKKAVFIFWHNKMLIGWKLFKGKGYAALVSQSKDGAILNNILKRWKYTVIRGSSSKGGKEAIEDIVNLISNNRSSVITPDGPRGPAGEVKNGALIISNKTGLPIIPVKIKYSRSKILSRSWDKFEIPLPFSRCEVTFGDEFYYKEYLHETELAEFKESLAKQM
jgi:lysophospholipid acyltransferase (LPLAT)-like uncharacterized protein